MAARPEPRGDLLGCATRGGNKTFDAIIGGGIHRNCVLKAVEDFIGGVLQASIGLMQFARGFGCELAELITIVYVRKGTKNQI